MKKLTITFGILSMLAIGCSDDPKDPAVPEIGSQIDRSGRAAINTALNNSYLQTDDAAAGAAKDNYNRATPSTWSSFSTEIAVNLGVLDGVEGTCGNQLLAGDPGEGRYSTLAGVLADDRLYVNSASGSCETYLAVEANATNLLANNDCGGRTPNHDVGDASYSVLAAGIFSGVSDGVTADADCAHSNTEFPFLCNPS